MITTPQGFRAASATAGIKASGKPDMALVVNDGPEYTAAAVFTRNKVVASPVKLSRAAVQNGKLIAVVYNSGNANACNGEKGDNDAVTVARAVADGLGISITDVAACSTGIIGEPLPVSLLVDATSILIANLSDDGTAAAEAIMTSDTVKKEAAVSMPGWSVGGMGKGVGMMAPSLATMLVCLTTDASISSEMAQTALKKATAQTFESLDIDGTTSTNDTVILLASGASGITPTQKDLNAAVLQVCDELASQMQADAEGVTKRVAITVTGTTTTEMALSAARTIARDNLFKCAMFGSDPNWGRTLAAVGITEADMDPNHISVYFNGEAVCLDSCETPNARSVDLSGTDIHVVVDLGIGGAGCATVRTTDLSLGYVHFNSAYTT